ncbi:MAG: acetate--CoA ligase family protein [Actinobacteria bacterium]|nr:acetate--CoA ligase family protein [Actinomycetota bacterium]
MASKDAIRTMLEARSVAVVGASPKKDSFGEMMMTELTRSGYDGAVYPVNPKYDEIHGSKAYPSITEIPEPVDLAILGVGNHLIEAQMQAAADAGARSVAIFASLHDPETGGQHALQERLGAIAVKHDMAVCGGNCMGFLNVDKKLRVCGFLEPDLPPGPIAFISHSGSVFSAMAWNDRDLNFNLIVSAGQEITTTTADYMHYALEQPTTRAIGLFIETIRDPDNFKNALIKAAERDIPVVALKVGRVAKAREMVAAHSGALAGEDGAYEALFEAYGVLRVENLERMCDTLELFSRNGRRAGPGGFASIHDSGGERAMIVDAADEAGVRFAEISEETVQVLEEQLDEGLPPINPLDAWGTGNEADRIFIECQKALHDDLDTAALAFAVDLNYEHGSDEDFVTIAKKVWSHTTKPYALLSNMAATIHQPGAKELRSVGIPVLEGTNTGLLAFRNLFQYRDFRALPPLAAPVFPADDVRERWRSRLTSGEPLGELDGLDLLADYGVPVIRASQVASVEAAVSAANEVGYPVALKTAVPGIQHKSDAGGVKLGLRDADEVRGAYEDLATRLGPEAIVAPMAPEGVELALGIVRDPQFGSLVLVAAGGILVELLKDRRMGVPPLDEPRARRLVDGLKSRALLDGVRGAAASDVDAVVRAVVAVSALASDLGDHIAALDVNPIIAGPDGCVAVDALVISQPR